MHRVVRVSARAFAELLGVAPETVSRWENGQRAVDPTVLRVATFDRFAGRSTSCAVPAAHALGGAVAPGRIEAPAVVLDP